MRLLLGFFDFFVRKYILIATAAAGFDWGLLHANESDYSVGTESRPRGPAYDMSCYLRLGLVFGILCAWLSA
jgi:hypothetical protein